MFDIIVAEMLHRFKHRVFINLRSHICARLLLRVFSSLASSITPYRPPSWFLLYVVHVYKPGREYSVSTRNQEKVTHLHNWDPTRQLNDYGNDAPSDADLRASDASLSSTELSLNVLGLVEGQGWDRHRYSTFDILELVKTQGLLSEDIKLCSSYTRYLDDARRTCWKVVLE